MSSSVPKQKSTAKSKQKCELCHYTTHTTDDCYRILFCMICKQEDHRTSDHKAHMASQNTSYKAQANRKASSSNQASKLKVTPFQPCPHCGFNDHLPDDCMMYPCCDICGDPTHDVSGHEAVTQKRRGIPSTSQSTESSTTNKCKVCGSTVHTTTDHSSINKFKQSIKTKPTKKWGPRKN